MSYPVAAVRNKNFGVAQASIVSPSFIYQNTTFTNDLAADGYSWSNALPITVDKYNKIIALCQRNNSGTKQHNFVYSNDNGATWADAGLSSGFLDRGSAVYDSINDLIHVLWNATASSDGIIYRRYSITRDGSNNITAIAQVAGINLQLDFEDVGTMSYQHPQVLFLSGTGANGTLLCVWSARNSLGAPNKNEVRSSMRVLTNDVNDNTAGNWVAPVSSDITTITQSPQVAYSALVANNNAGIAYPSIGRKSSGTKVKDLYLCYHNGASPGQWRFNRFGWSSGSSNFSNGSAGDTLITNQQRAGTDTGYSLKAQLGSFVKTDGANDRMVFAFPTWKDNTNGDTWGYVGINSDDSLTSLVDAYSAGGAHSFAPTGDITYDSVSQRLAVAWLTTSTEYVQVQLYNGLATQGLVITAYSAVSPNGVDIPLLYPRLNGKLLIMFRDRVDQPGANLYRGLFGTLNWN